jgi:hypothetical protein
VAGSVGTHAGCKIPPLGLPFTGLPFFHSHPLLGALAVGVHKTVKSLLLLLERLGVSPDGLRGTVEFINGIFDLMVAQNTSCGEVGRQGKLLGPT